MKKNLVVLLIFLVILTGCSKNVESNINYNTNEGITNDRTQDGLKFTESSLTSTSSSSVLVTSVTNETTDDKDIKFFKINITDIDGNLLASLEGYVGGIIKANETKVITSNIDINLDSAYNISYEIIK